MPIDKSKVTNIPVHTDDYYEALASQEQQYLDEIVEHLRERELLASHDSSSGNNPFIFESLIETLHQAAEELITGDCDDPPLSDQAVVELLRITFKA